jgi:hypothetical protein
MSSLEQAYAADITMRREDEKLEADGISVSVEEYDRDGVVYENGGVKVIAFEVDHGDVIKPAYGYRVDYDGLACAARRDGDNAHHVDGAQALSEIVNWRRGRARQIEHAASVAQPGISATLELLDHHDVRLRKLDPTEQGQQYPRPIMRCRAFEYAVDPLESTVHDFYPCALPEPLRLRDKIDQPVTVFAATNFVDDMGRHGRRSAAVKDHPDNAGTPSQAVPLRGNPSETIAAE